MCTVLSSHHRCVLSAIITASAISTSAVAQGTGPGGPLAGYTPPADVFIYTVLVITLALIVVAVIAIVNALAQSAKNAAAPWRLSDALSEEGDVTNPQGMKITIMVASSSRLIALLGMIVIMALFLATGTIAIWTYAKTGSAGNFDGMLKYFLAGASLFVPYSINQIRAGFESIGKS
ncbi:MAG: hypothetical protein KGJ78_11155 [Alphaproteobacteria bacterium]|nr:hypothetical protein [Alphaproteobacteria bacterium]